MSLKHALLGILTVKPMTGYELKQFFDSTVQHFWNAELSQIYPTLKHLEEQGWVEKRVEVQESRPNKKIYEITDDGKEEYTRWALHPLPPADLRDPFLIRVFFGDNLSVEDMLVLLRHQMEEQQKVLAFNEAVLRPKIKESVEALGSTRRGLFWTLTLEMAIAHRRAYVEWCEQSMKLLEQTLLDGKSSLDAEFPAKAEAS
jgi:DNA-binding PadR family transcriptional regulator